MLLIMVLCCCSWDIHILLSPLLFISRCCFFQLPAVRSSPHALYLRGSLALPAISLLTCQIKKIKPHIKAVMSSQSLKLICPMHCLKIELSHYQIQFIMQSEMYFETFSSFPMKREILQCSTQTFLPGIKNSIQKVNKLIRIHMKMCWG